MEDNLYNGFIFFLDNLLFVLDYIVVRVLQSIAKKRMIDYRRKE